MRNTTPENQNAFIASIEADERLTAKDKRLAVAKIKKAADDPTIKGPKFKTTIRKPADPDTKPEDESDDGLYVFETRDGRWEWNNKDQRWRRVDERQLAGEAIPEYLECVLSMQTNTSEEKDFRAAAFALRKLANQGLERLDAGTLSSQGLWQIIQAAMSCGGAQEIYGTRDLARRARAGRRILKVALSPEIIDSVLAIRDDLGAEHRYLKVKKLDEMAGEKCVPAISGSAVKHYRLKRNKKKKLG
jgi:hypothetical protein